MRTRNTLAALIAATALSLAGGGVALAAPPAPTQGPNSQACTDAKKNVVDLTIKLRAAVDREHEKEQSDLRAAQASLAAALPALREFNPTVYPGGVPALGAITPAYLRSIVAKADREGATSQLGGGGRDAINNALGLFSNVAAAERAIKDDNGIVTGLRAQLKLAEAKRDDVCASPAPTTTPASPAPTTTPGTPAPPATVVEKTRTIVVDNDDNGSYPSRAPQTGGV